MKVNADPAPRKTREELKGVAAKWGRPPGDLHDRCWDQVTPKTLADYQPLWRAAARNELPIHAVWIGGVPTVNSDPNREVRTIFERYALEEFEVSERYGAMLLETLEHIEIETGFKGGEDG